MTHSAMLPTMLSLIAFHSQIEGFSGSSSNPGTKFGWFKNAFKSTVGPFAANETVIVGGSTADLLNPSSWVYYPKISSALVRDGDASHSILYDFNGLNRSATHPTIGAYETSGAAPTDAWKVHYGFKTVLSNPWGS